MTGEGVGSIVHEMVHVVQQFGSARVPLWLTEGSADYVRFYRFEPQTHGADIRPADAAKARYDASYRTSANFLNWVSNRYDPNLVPELNSAIRQGAYKDNLWQKFTGHSLENLGAEWKNSIGQ